MRRRLGDGADRRLVADVVAEDGVEEAEVGGGAVGQVADDQSVGLAAVLVRDEQVRVAVRARGLDELGDDERAAVDARGAREEELQLLGEGGQPRGGVARGGQQQPRRALGRAPVLVVDVRARDGRVVVLEVDLAAQGGLLAAQLCRDRLAL